MTADGSVLACGYLTTTAGGAIEQANDRVLAMTGYGRAEILGRRVTELLTAGGRMYYDTHLAPILQVEGRVDAVALDLLRADGDRVPVLLNAVTDRGADGGPCVHVALFEAADRRSYERELLAEEQRARASERRAIELARTLQATLIPPDPPSISGLDVATAYRPAGDGDEVGGDFFDVFEALLDEWYVIAGDVSGKGVDAAIVSSRARRALRERALRHPDPGALLRAVNAELHAERVARYCTVVAVRLTRRGEGWIAEVATAGHPHPLLVRDGQVRPVGRPGSLIGALPDAHVETVPVELLPGDLLLLHTDGVTEGRRGEVFYGEERLAEQLQRTGAAGPAAAVASLLDAVVGFQDGWPRDDIVLVGLGVPPAGAGGS